MSWAKLGLGMIVATMLATPAEAAKEGRKPAQTPPQVNALLACRGIADSAERLACYDKAAGTIGDAVAKEELVVFDREGVRKTKRGLFGFSIPNLGIFGDDDGTEVKQIEGAIAGYGHNADGGYIFRLADGTRWSQMDDKVLAIPPRNGEKVVVKRGALGSYILALDKRPGVKVKRIQ